MTEQQTQVIKYADQICRAECMFERVYFMYVSSVLKEASIHQIRLNLGIELARIEPLRGNFDEDMIVVPIPHTSKTAAKSYANKLVLPYEEGILKNEIVGRAFIEKQDRRKAKLDEKFNIIKDIILGKKIIAVDDSRVRGDTTRKLIDLLMDYGAKEVHMRYTCPPIIAPCFYGIDFATIEELPAAYSDNIAEIEQDAATESGAKTVKYNTIEGLISALLIGKENLCCACLTGQYPTPAGQKKYDALLEEFKRKQLSRK